MAAFCEPCPLSSHIKVVLQPWAIVCSRESISRQHASYCHVPAGTGLYNHCQHRRTASHVTFYMLSAAKTMAHLGCLLWHAHFCSLCASVFVWPFNDLITIKEVKLNDTRPTRPSLESCFFLMVVDHLDPGHMSSLWLHQHHGCVRGSQATLFLPRWCSAW